VREGITLEVDQDARLDFAMKVGQVDASITVTAGAPLINTESGELGTTLDSQQVEDLPSLNATSSRRCLYFLLVSVWRDSNFDNDPPLRFSVNGGTSAQRRYGGGRHGGSLGQHYGVGFPSSPTRTPCRK